MHMKSLSVGLPLQMMSCEVHIIRWQNVIILMLCVQMVFQKK